MEMTRKIFELFWWISLSRILSNLLDMILCVIYVPVTATFNEEPAKLLGTVGKRMRPELFFFAVLCAIQCFMDEDPLSAIVMVAIAFVIGDMLPYILTELLTIIQFRFLPDRDRNDRYVIPRWIHTMLEAKKLLMSFAIVVPFIGMRLDTNTNDMIQIFIFMTLPAIILWVYLSYIIFVRGK